MTAIATDYGALMEGIHEVYTTRALELLALIGTYCRDAGFKLDGPHDYSCDRYEWILGVFATDSTPAVDVKLEMIEEAEVTDVTHYGVSFFLTVQVSETGWEIASLTPENYTDGWVVDGRDPQAVSDRFELISRSPALATIPELIKAHR